MTETTPTIMPINDELLAELELLAGNVVSLETTEEPGIGSAYDSFEATANPSTILALLQHVRELKADRDRLDAIEANCWDVRYDSHPNADAGDGNISIEIVGHFMGRPFERVVGENYSENLRAAIDQAMTADAYPPARPEYD